MSKIPIYVPEILFKDVSRSIDQFTVKPTIETLQIDESLWQTKILELAKRSKFTVAVIPPSWVFPSVSEYHGELITAIHAGVLRLAVWGASPKTHAPIPLLYLPIDRGNAVLSSQFLHLGQAALPGITSILPADSASVVSERVCSDKEIGQKLDKVLSFSTAQGFTLGDKGMRARIAVSACLTNAFEDNLARKTSRPRTPTLQLGAFDKLIGFSVKWQTQSTDLETWTKPSFLCLIASSLADAFWLHLIPESSEVEAIFLFALDEPPKQCARPMSGLGVDILTNARLAAVRQQAEFMERSGVNFSALKDIKDLPPTPELNLEAPSPSVSETHVNERNQGGELIRVSGESGASGGFGSQDEKASNVLSTANKDPVVEIANLKAEQKKLQTANEGMKKNISDLTTKLTQAIESEKKAKHELKVAGLQTKTMPAGPSEKEAELANKLKAALNTIQQLQKQVNLAQVPARKVG